MPKTSLFCRIGYLLDLEEPRPIDFEPRPIDFDQERRPTS